MVLGKSRLLPGFVAVVILGGGLYLAFALTRPPAAGRVDTQLVTGRQLYVAHCASCHGANLEGQANWQTRRPDGKLPAPPHDATGHTWHHADRVLFDITRQVPADIGPTCRHSATCSGTKALPQCWRSSRAPGRMRFAADNRKPGIRERRGGTPT